MNEYVGAILAAGRGSRMGAISEYYPKPLLPVANEPLIGHHLYTLRRIGIREVFIVVGHGASRIIDRVGDGAEYDVQVTYIDQECSLGSAHALGKLAPYIGGPFVLLLGDYFFSAPGLVSLLEMAKSETCSVIAAKREKNRTALCEACVLDTDEQGRLLRIVEKPASPSGDLKGCGIYIFQPGIFDAVRRTPRTAFRDEYEVSISIELLIQTGLPVYAKEVVEWDINFTRPEDILRCNLAWLERQGKGELIGANVRMAKGTHLERTVVGDNVVISEPSILRDVVVFGGAQIPKKEQIEWALVTPASVVRCIREPAKLEPPKYI